MKALILRGFIYQTVSLAVLLLSISIVLAAEKPTDVNKRADLDQLYHSAMLEFKRKNYNAALPLFKKYVNLAKTEPYKRNRLVWVIDNVGRIYLTEQHNPDAAIEYFGELTKESAINEEEFTDVEGWLVAAIDWKRFGKMPSEIKTAEGLFILGNQFYQKGLSKLKYPLDNAGNADFHIAASYLIPLIVHFDKDQSISDALYMMGDIRRHIRTDNLYWSENFYIKEVIRRFPHTELAEKAWEILNDDVHFAYSGSAGDSTPTEQLKMLERYKALAYPKSK